MESQSLLSGDGGGGPGSPLLEGPAQGYGTTANTTEPSDEQTSEPMSNRSRRSTTTPRSVTSVKRYRLSLLIVMSFDTSLVVFLSILCFLTVSSGENVTSYFTNFNIRESVFDVVMMATIRFVLLSLFYLILGWVTRIILIVTTLASTFYVPVKAYYFWSGLSEDGNPDVKDIQYILVLLFLFGAFVMPWIVAFFFEFKFLPAELSRLSTTSWFNWKVWLCPWMLINKSPLLVTSPEEDSRRRGPPLVTTPHSLARYSSMDTVFRTPLGSPRGSPMHFESDDLETIREERILGESPEPAECDQYSSENEQYRILANEAVQLLERLGRTYNNWTLEKEQDGIKCYSFQGESRKIWKSELLLNVSVDSLWRTLYHEAHRTPEWNTNVAINDIIYRIDRTTDIMYTATMPIAMVSSRDFVSVRKASVRGGRYYCANVSVTFSGKPPTPDRVRGLNGPCGYVLVPMDTSRTLFIWVLDTDLKGWIPQTVVDQTFSGSLLSANTRLRTFVNASM